MEGVDAEGLVDQTAAQARTEEEQLTEEFFNFFMESEMMDDVLEDVGED